MRASFIRPCTPRVASFTLVVCLSGGFAASFHAPRRSTELQSSPVSAQPTYSALVERYRSGDFKAAVAELTAWSSARLAEEARVERLPNDQKTWAAAAVLHLDVIISLDDPPLERVHLDAARAELSQLKGAPFLPDFLRNWYPAAITCLARTDVLSARKLLGEIPPEFREDAQVQLAAGLVEEALSRMTVAGKAAAWRAAIAAEDSYRRALALDPALVEARLRLGHLFLQSGRTAEAAIEFERVRGATNVPVLSYLAGTWLGNTQEEAGRAETAAALYRAAIGTMPSSQPAYLSLIRLLLATGHPDDAFAATERMFAETGSRSSSGDPWSQYLSAQLSPLALEPRLAPLRDMVKR